MTDRARLASASAACVAGLACVILPVWLAPVVVTTDGPSHVYNAFLASAIEAGDQPFANLFEHDASVAGWRFSERVLARIGPVLGWDTAERLVLSAAAASVYCAGLLLIGGAGGRPVVPLVPGVALLANSWFTWMGFYDFVLATSFVAVVVLLLQAHPARLWHLALLQVVLLVLLRLHLFAFAVGVGLAAGTLAWDAVRARGRWTNVAAVIPVLVVAVLSDAAAAVGGRSLAWGSPLKAVAGLIAGDVMVTFSAVGVIPGVLLMGTVWMTVWLKGRDRPRSLDALLALGALLLLGSVIAPDRLGEGSYIPARLRLLGIVTLLPAVAEALRGAAPKWRWSLGTVWSGALLLHTGEVIRAGQRVNRDLEDMDRCLLLAGASRGSWIATVPWNAERHLFRISGYLHLADRPAWRMGLLTIQNFEAEHRSFPVRWRRRPNVLAFERTPVEWSMTLGERELYYPQAIVLHESKAQVVSSDGRLGTGRTAVCGDFAATTVIIRPSSSVGGQPVVSRRIGP